MKHAFLIIAHNDFELLKNQLMLLDSARSDIYIHIDKKSKFNNFQSIYDIIKHAKLHIYKEFSVKWGDESQVLTEMFLLKKSIVDEHNYYHILSGVDMPIKPIDQILNYFDENIGKEFIHFDSPKIREKELDRVLYRHYLNSFYKISKSKLINKAIFVMDNFLVFLQKIFKLKRFDDNFKIQKGCNWCSITHNLASFLVAKEMEIKEFVKYSKCADELFIQTFVENSDYKNKLYRNDYDNNYSSCARLIIWENNKAKSPYTFRSKDFNFLASSNAMFARKFSTLQNDDLVDNWTKYILDKNKEKDNKYIN